ncbi:carbon-nitrogen hydrolase family protein [Agromyces silvae]|uniref:carbon-nitrogen hydrolase family protein n=1 Tax=Agromyces silvae TaxID=3388266 RepID=UPI00280AC725|nr:carbon-nitrogen hydrolase family protein [Agromyces protaetiae]
MTQAAESATLDLSGEASVPTRRSETLLIALAQPATSPSDIAGNAERHAEAIRSAQARLILFPELSLTGYRLQAPALELDDPRLQPLIDAARDCRSIAIVGAPTRDGEGREFISSIRVHDGSADVVYHKRTLHAPELNRFAPGRAARTITVDGWKVGMSICKDTSASVHTSDLARLDVDLYAAGVVHSPEEFDEQSARGFVAARACRAYAAFASFAGRAGAVYPHTCGRSTIWGPDGEVLAAAGDQTGEVVRHQLTSSRLSATRTPAANCS